MLQMGPGFLRRMGGKKGNALVSTQQMEKHLDLHGSPEKETDDTFQKGA
jgi:hypothetical protein